MKGGSSHECLDSSFSDDEAPKWYMKADEGLQIFDAMEQCVISECKLDARNAMPIMMYLPETYDIRMQEQNKLEHAN